MTDFEELKKLLDDGSVSPLDALRLKNDFRRIGPERAQVVRTDLAASEAELTTYENALTDAEIDLVNDSRDDRFDRERRCSSSCPKPPVGTRPTAMLDDLEARHRIVAQPSSGRPEEPRQAGRGDRTTASSTGLKTTSTSSTPSSGPTSSGSGTPSRSEPRHPGPRPGRLGPDAKGPGPAGDRGRRPDSLWGSPLRRPSS